MRGLMIYWLLEGKQALIVGGGAEAAKKVPKLKGAGARVRVVAPEILPELTDCEHVFAPFEPSHLNGIDLVIAATNDHEVNVSVSVAARAAGIPVNVADVPEWCDFYLTANVIRGQLAMGISTGGACPGFASMVRRKMQSDFGPEWSMALEVVAAARAWANAKGLTWSSLLGDELLMACASNDRDAVNQLLGKTLGAEVTLDTLAVEWS